MRYRLVTVLLAAVLTSAAQETSHMIGLGSTHILDTYLSQEHFSGSGFTYLYIHERAKPERHWGTLLEHELDIANTEDRSGNLSELEGSYNFYAGRYRHWHLLGDRLHLQAGGLANVCLGFIYDMTSSNNPAQARVGLNIMPAGAAAYRFRLLKQEFSLRYELNLPLVGIMFSPNYGQSYYEIFTRGNYDHNIVPTTFVSAPTFRQILTLDWHTGKKWDIRIGYLGNYQQAAVNNLKQHVYVHQLMIGLTTTLR